MSRPPDPNPDVIEVSRWSTSSSEEEEEGEGEGEGHEVGSRGSQTSQDKNSQNKEAHDKDAGKKDDHAQNEEEVIYELDEDAMSQLPDHLQTNMREMQQERMDRVHRENSNVQVRKVSEASVQSEARADNWFKSMLSRFPPRPSMGFHAKRDNIRHLNRPRLDDMEAHERARLASGSPLYPLTKDNLEYLTESTGGETNAMVEAVRRRRVHKATSIKDRIYSRLGTGTRRSEPALIHIQNIESQVHIGIPQRYGRCEEEDDQVSVQVPEEEKHSLRGRVKKSMHKMSTAFKKG